MTLGTGKRPNPVDQAQLRRIEVLHRGFLFQHIYAAMCLLEAGTHGYTSVTVESDEDVEVALEDLRGYLQIKHRETALSWGDIEGALGRFAALRAVHRSGERGGKPKFAIVCNIAPDAALAKRLNGEDWPDDVQILSPDAKANLPLPVPAASLLQAIDSATEAAGRLPFASLAPETLVLKLCSLVMLAATGEQRSLDHVFQTEELTGLFEQLVQELQDLPAPPIPYRGQEDEPALRSGQRVRLITGYSGAGKTSWVAQSAQQAVGPLAYLDIADVPGPALAHAVGRELVGRLAAAGGNVSKLLVPGSSAVAILQALSRRLADQAISATLVLDNAHRLPADDLVVVVDALASAQILLLARPEGEIAATEARLKITSEQLKGWSADTVAAAALDAGCVADVADCERLISLTGGLPLYVQNGLIITVEDYQGRLRAFCTDLAASTQSRETAQEFILGRVFEGLLFSVQQVAELLSLADTPLSRTEINTFLANAAGLDEPTVVAAMRRLRHVGLLQVYSENRVKMHDAARVIGRGRLVQEGQDALRAKRTALRNVVRNSVLANWNIGKLTLFLRLSVQIGDLSVLAEMVTDEIFHEMGVWPEVEQFLARAVADETQGPEERLKALDGLAFAHLKSGDERAGAWLDQMDALIAKHDLGAEERLRVGMKRMTLLARDGELDEMEALIESIAPIVEALPESHTRIFRYNLANAYLALGHGDVAESLLEQVAAEYYERLGLTPAMVMGRNAPELVKILKEGADADDIKHLADTLDTWAKAMEAQGRVSPFLRVHALKFFDVARAPESLLRVGQDLVDQHVRAQDFVGARQMCENILLPQLGQLKIADYVVPIRSQYAVVLAYNGAFALAEAEMSRLSPYEGALSDAGRAELRAQRDLLAQLKRYGPPPDRSPSPEFLARVAEAMNRRGHKPLWPDYRRKVGRNETCSCGSGKKYKKCCGSSTH